MHQLQRRIEVDVVEFQHGQRAREAAAPSLVLPQMDLLKLPHHELRSQAACPFVEIAQDNARAGVRGVVQHLIAEQQRTLRAPLEIACPQMDVEDVQQDTFS